MDCIERNLQFGYCYSGADVLPSHPCAAVDSSAPALKLAQENADLNGITQVGIRDSWLAESRAGARPAYLLYS
jgi:methylase of polypeptide subunit release factors